MAGYFGAALAGGLQGYNQALQQGTLDRQRAVMLAGEIQKQHILNQQLKDQQDAAVMLADPNVYYGSNVPAGGSPAPAPGQPSVPAHPEGVGPGNIAPYRAFPDIISSIRQRYPNASPMAINSVASQISKQENSQSQAEIKMLTLQNSLLNTQSLIDSRREMAADRKLSIQDREQASRDLMDLRKQEADLKAQIAGWAHQDREQATQARVELANQKLDAQRQKQVAPISSLIDQIDSAIRMIDQDPSIVGARGMLSRAGEFIGTLTNPYAQTPASDFQQQILSIQSGWRKLPTVAANRFKSDYNKIDSSVKGIGTFTSPAMARNSLVQLRNQLSAQMGEGGNGQNQSSALPPGIPQGSKLVGKTPDGRDVYQSPDGKHWTP